MTFASTWPSQQLIVTFPDLFALVSSTVCKHNVSQTVLFRFFFCFQLVGGEVQLQTVYLAFSLKTSCFQPQARSPLWLVWPIFSEQERQGYRQESSECIIYVETGEALLLLFELPEYI